VASLALDGGADSRVIARAVGILAAADAIVVKAIAENSAPSSTSFGRVTSVCPATAPQYVHTL
jgi:hypothetical protein